MVEKSGRSHRSESRSNWVFAGEAALALQVYLDYVRCGSNESWKPHIVALADSYQQNPFEFSPCLDLKANVTSFTRRPILRDWESVLFKRLPKLCRAYIVSGRISGISHAIAELCVYQMAIEIKADYESPDGTPSDICIKSLCESHGFHNKHLNDAINSKSLSETV